MGALTNLAAVSGTLLAAGFWTLGGGGDLDERLPVSAGGSLEAAIALGDGISFDRGSLHIRSHAEQTVRVVADTSGWGGYAVDLDLSQEGQRVAVDGRVEGPLHWMFGGPTVDVEIWVPQDFAVNATIEGGPLVLEDLVGPITARVGDADVTVQRAEGSVAVLSSRASVEVEDVHGDVQIETSRGDVDVTGVHGSLRIETARGSVDVASVTGAVGVKSGRGRVEVERVRGDVEVASDRGRIEMEDIEGRVVARTSRGDIELEEVDGTVLASSGRGSIDVEFAGDPRGEVTTARGSISVEVPEGAGFDLDAHTARGSIELGDGQHFWERLGDARAPELAAPGEAATREHGWQRRRAKGVERTINGGGERLTLHTDRGSIRIEQ